MLGGVTLDAPHQADVHLFLFQETSQYMPIFMRLPASLT